MPRSQHSFVAPSGLNMAVHDWGGDGNPILLAHATGFHGVVWQPIAERLAARGRSVFSFDFRGHGDSDSSPDARFAWSEFADDADAVLDHLELRAHPDLITVGHSKGAASLLAVAARDPLAFPCIWGFEPIVFPSSEQFPSEEGNPMSVAARKRRDIWPSRDAAIESYGARPPLDVLRADALRAYVDYGVRDLADGTVELKCRPEHEANMYMMGAANGLYARLPDVTCTTLVVCGGDSRSISPVFGGVLAERLPRGRLEVWDGCGHFGPMEDPDRAVESILSIAI